MSNVLSDIFSNRKQRVVLYGQTSFYAKIDAGVAQEFILGLFLLLIYINDLSDSLSSNVKLFADETSLFPVKHDINAPVSTEQLLKENQWSGFPFESEFQSWS